MSFPLGEWIDRHSDAPHNLGQSGLRDSLASVRDALRRTEPPDAPALIGELAAIVGVEPSRLFLTHGATEGISLALVFLARHFADSSSRAPRFTCPRPEYPSLPDIARWTGFAETPVGEPADVAIASDPHNPTGGSPPIGGGFGLALERAAALLVDETYREFGSRPSRSAAGDPRTWTTGTFTKVYGADDIRVGYVVVPPEMTDRFGRFHGVVTDEVPPASIAAARALLRDRERILREARDRFERNLAALRSAVPSAPALRAPIYFDRGVDGWDGDALAAAALRRGVLVCPGSFFGDPTGVRIGLTRTSFPEDLAVYRAVRDEWLGAP